MERKRHCYAHDEDSAQLVCVNNSRVLVSCFYNITMRATYRTQIYLCSIFEILMDNSTSRNLLVHSYFIILRYNIILALGSRLHISVFATN